MDEAALGVGLDREDINYLVAQNLASLEGSKFWMGEIVPARTPPIVAIWPIENRTTQHLEDQMVTLLSSIETTFVNSGEVRVVARNEQENLIDEIDRQSRATPREEDQSDDCIENAETRHDTTTSLLSG